MDIKEKEELLLKISNLEKQVKYLKDRLSTRKKLNNQKKNTGNYDSSTDEEDGSEFEYDDADDDINMEELESKSNDEIIKVAKSIGISSGSGCDSNEILKSIRDKINSKRSQRQKRMGSMVKRKSLLIVPMDSGEKLFWKIVRNSFLFKKVLSFLNTASYTLKYDLIFDCQQLINSRETQLLKYKVKRGDYLTSIDLAKVFGFIKDDQEFYSSLFKHYSRILFNLIGRVNSAIKASCVAAIQVLINEYDYKPTVDAIKETIKNQSFKTFKCLLDFYKVNSLQLPLQDVELWKLIFGSVDAVKDDIVDESKKKAKTPDPAPVSKVVNRYSRYSRYNKPKREKKEKNTKISKITKFINYLIQDHQLALPSLTKQKLPKLFQCPFYDDYSIGDLLNSCRSILLFDFKVNYSTIIPATALDSSTPQFNSLQELNSTFSVLNKDRLKQTVYEYFIENYQVNHHTQLYGNIIKLLAMHYSIFGRPSLAYLILTSKADTIAIKKCLESKSSYYLECMYIDGLRFGEINVLLNHPNANTVNYMNNVLKDEMFPKYLDPQSYLFQFNIDKVKKIQFIRILAESLGEKKLASIDIPLLLNLIVANDDLEVLELAYSQLGKPLWDVQAVTNRQLKKDVLYFTKSKEILEYLVNNFFKNVNNPIEANSLIYNGRLDLLERYIELLPSLVKVNFRYTDGTEYPIELFQVFKRLLVNPAISRSVDAISKHFLCFDVSYIPLYQIIQLLNQHPDLKLSLKINKLKKPYFFILAHRWLNHQKNEDLKKRLELIETRELGEDEDEDTYYDEDNTERWDREEYDFISSPFDFNNIPLYNNSLSSLEGGGYMEFIDNFMKVNFLPKSNEPQPTSIEPQPTSIEPQSTSKSNHGVFRNRNRNRNGNEDDFGLILLLKQQAKLGNLELFKSICSNGFKFIFKKEKAPKKGQPKKFNIPSIALREIFMGALLKDHLDMCLFLLDESDVSVPDNVFNNNVKKNSVTHFNLMSRFNFNFK